MAYYDQQGTEHRNPDGTKIRERIPDPGVAGSLSQLSVKGENILVGEIMEDDVPEHNLTPLLKVGCIVK